MVASPPDIRSYTDYRKFLRDYYEFRKGLRSGFSYRLLASRCGIKSPNYLQLVIQGKRNLSELTGLKVAKAANLSEAERGYFVGLVNRANAKSEAEQTRAEKMVLVALKRMMSKEIPSAQAEILARWWHLVIREMTLLTDFRADGAWISERLRGLVSPTEADASLKKLIQSGFIKKDRKGRLVQSDPLLDTGNQFDAVRVRNLHVDTLAVWQKLIPELPADRRELGLTNIPLSAERIPEFKRRIRAFQEEIIGWAQDEKAADQVVQLGVYLVPLTK